MTVHEGQRIRIRQDYHWARGATGSVLLHPFNSLLTRRVKARSGEKTFVWVQFDEAQIDTDGDGPYRREKKNERRKQLWQG